MAHTLTFSGVSVTVDGVSVTSPYTLTNSCTIIAELTADKPTPTTPQPELVINDAHYSIDTTISISNTDITIKGYKGDTGIVATINYTESSTPRLSVDLTTLPGWANLSAGSHDITVVAKADGYMDSAPSAAVSVTKAATMPVKGDIITLDSKQYRVLKTEGTVAEVLAMYDATTSQAFNTNNSNVYENSDLDAYCNQTFYNSLSNTMQNAIVAKTFRQDSWQWDGGSSAIANYVGISGSGSNYTVSLMSLTFGMNVTRKCYVLSCQDVIDYLDATTSMTSDNTTLTNENIWKMFWNQITSPDNTYPWLSSACASNSNQAMYVRARFGTLNNTNVDLGDVVRPAFQIDLSKISWSK